MTTNQLEALYIFRAHMGDNLNVFNIKANYINSDVVHLVTDSEEYVVSLSKRSCMTLKEKCELQLFNISMKF